jgi:RNA polymerase sigma-70 factor (ECF subfamily)
MSEDLGRRPPLERAAATAPEHVQIPMEDLERFFHDHHALVFRAAYRVTGNAADAEDVLQTVFLRLLQRSPEATVVENAKSYLCRSAINAALDLLRSRQNARSVPLEDQEAVLVDGSAPAPDRAYESGEVRDWLRKTVARLSPMGAEVFALRFFEGKENPEIAQMLGTTTSSVAVTLSRARDRIQKEFRSFMRGAL